MNQRSLDSCNTLDVAFVQSRWHADIVDACREACAAEIDRLSDGRVRLAVFDVPGAFEIPLQARTLARSGRYAAIVGCALVADGGIYRHEFVAQAAVNGLMQAQMETDVPVLSAVLTPHHFHDSAEHREFFLGHFAVKGREVAAACVSILSARRALACAA